ncbi:MAG: KH domain-containing protein [bacterium]|nr:KH domain-containing protein [bacterium]
MAELLEFIVKRLVDYPDDVLIKEVQGERTKVLEIKVNDADMGKVIGKKGRIIKSLRIVVRAAALHDGQSVSIEIVNEKEPE